MLECCSLSSGQFTQRLQSDWLQKEKDPGFVPGPTRFYVLLGMDASVFGGVLRLDLGSFGLDLERVVDVCLRVMPMGLLLSRTYKAPLRSAL